MKNPGFLLVVILLTVLSVRTHGQGCVAIRGSACGGTMGGSLNLHKGEINPEIGFRHFKSFRHFRSDTEETHRLEEGTEVINYSSFVDVALNYGLTDRLFASLTLPFVFHRRSSMYEHGGNPPNGLGERHETSSSGLSDTRVAIGYWFLDPEEHESNYSVAAGLKLPTGKYDYTDTFYNQGPDRDQDVTRVVDQSIQPGEGGIGLTMDVQGFQQISQHFALSSSLYYLFNFQETNGVLTRNGSSEFSCPDQYAARVGGQLIGTNGLNYYLGGRVEGVPAEDLIGGSAGYRRPGYAVSAEPGLGYFKSGLLVFASVPIALYRNRTQSFQDKERTDATGVYRHGDAAFADFLISLRVSYRFGGKDEMAFGKPMIEGVTPD